MLNLALRSQTNSLLYLKAFGCRNTPRGFDTTHCNPLGVSPRLRFVAKNYADTVVPGYALPSFAVSPSANVFTSS